MKTPHDETRSFIEMSGPDGPRLVRLPALDGVRGLAVVAVVLYHLDLNGMIGGYLGVSTFFTLSGFLITSLLLNESRRTGSVNAVKFWSRRFRRLLPASLFTLALVSTLFARLVADADQKVALRGDVLASLFNVANWRFILSGSKYGDFNGSPSPVVHFWSLSIEEQFYILFPLALLGLWWVVKRRRRHLALVLAAAALVSAALPWALSMSTNRAYLGTDTRASELLVGSLLAIVLSYESVRRTIALRYRPRTALVAMAAISLGLQAYWWWTVPQSSTWLYRGGLTLYAIMTCLIIAAAALPGGPFRRSLATAPFRWLGTRSYGIYLYHWPLILAARQLWPDTSHALTESVAVALALVVAEASYHLIEQPIRLGRWPDRRWSLRVTGMAVVAVAVLASLPLPVNKADLSTDFESALSEFDARRPEADPVPTTDPSIEASKSPPAFARVATFGDSTALLVGLGLGGDMNDGSVTNLVDAGGDVELGCGVSRFAELRLYADKPPMDQCLSWQPRWAEVIDKFKPDIAQLITGAWEVPDAKLPGSDAWTSIGEPQADEFIRSELNAAIDTLSSSGAMVLLVLWPDYAPWTDTKNIQALADQAVSGRMERLHEIMREIASSRPETVRTLDLSEFLGPERLADKSLRPDGLHISAEKMAELYKEGLADKTYDIWREWWIANNR